MASRTIWFVDLTATAGEGRRLGAITSALGLAPDVGTAMKCSAAFNPPALATATSTSR